MIHISDFADFYILGQLVKFINNLCSQLINVCRNHLIVKENYICTFFFHFSDYDVDLCLQYKLLESYDNFTSTSSDSYIQPTSQEDESDEETGEDDQCSEDYYALLVKAWEQKVFPVIRRRFRNEAERKDGLEQIRGALQLGNVNYFLFI